MHEPDDFRSSMHWRIFRIMSELMQGWQFVADFPNNVAIFGSAQLPPEHPWCLEARKMGKLLADNGFSVLTGGGPGIMQAANEGASLSKASKRGESVGLDVKLGKDSRANPFVQKAVSFHYFFVRNYMINYSARAYIYFPGGLGTLDNLTALITLIQTKKVSADVPLILVNKEFWGPTARWIKNIMYEKFKAIDEADMKMYHLVDTAEEALELVKKAPRRKEFY